MLQPGLTAASGTVWGIARLETTVFFGEFPHNLAVAMLPLGWLMLVRYWEAPNPRRFACAAAVCAVIMSSNAFGLVVIVISAFLLWFAVPARRAQMISTSLILSVSYLLTCRLLPPWLLLEEASNSQTIAGDYRSARWLFLVIPMILCALVWSVSRMKRPVVKFAVPFAAVFTCVAGIWYLMGVAIVPQPHRYILEAELGFSLLLPFALPPLWRRLLPRVISVCAVACCALWLFRSDYLFARRMIRPADLPAATSYREATWIKAL